MDITARNILLATEPESIFSEPSRIEQEYRQLAMRFHPDQGGDAEVFAQLTWLMQAARARRRQGEWHVPGRMEQLELRTSDSRTWRIRYLRQLDIGMGRAYIAREQIAYALHDDYADMAESAQRMIRGFRYPTGAVRDGMQKRLPVLKAAFCTQDRSVLILSQPAGSVLLRDLLARLGSPLDPRHVAWMISELLNLACWLQWSNIVHCDISPTTLFVQPAQHRVALLGGWWYAVAQEHRMARRQQARTVAYMPAAIRRTKQADAAVDLNLIRLTGRELLGDASGMRLCHDPAVPAAMSRWLCTSAGNDARRDYHDWQDVLTAAFGARRFVRLDIDAGTFYSTGV